MNQRKNGLFMRFWTISGKRLPTTERGCDQLRVQSPSGLERNRVKWVGWIICAIVAAVSCNGSTAQAQDKNGQEIVVAAAADLSSALKDVADRFEKKTGVKAKLSFGASGALTQQIENGAPFDVFFSADMDYPRHLVDVGDAEAGSLYQYVVGKLVLWIPADSPLKLEQGMKVLLDPSVKKIAMANPQHAPYGRAAVAAMKHYGLYDQVAGRLVLGENVSQAAQFVESGNAQAGFVALAHAIAPGIEGKGRYWEVPADAYPPLAQGAVVLSKAAHKKEATEFLEYMKSKEGKAVLEKYGFSLGSR